MPFGRSLLQKKSLLRVSGEERSPEILISFHSSGSTSKQWRKLKNPWFPGRTLFRPSCFETRKKKRFFAQLAYSAGPLYIIFGRRSIRQWVSKLFVSSSASSSPESEAFSSRSSTSYPWVISWRSGLLLILRRDRIRGLRLRSLCEARLSSFARPFRLDKMTPLFSGSALLGGGYRS
ncbi:hypothetical protein ACH5RR_000075 [Cinchona calisaya]|uniref:Ribosomal protein L10 n=1 Tax=Cinchona calisaya TaxID=153742 RepID=A0ABD3AZR5_9GENT